MKNKSHYRDLPICRVPMAHGKATKTHGKKALPCTADGNPPTATRCDGKAGFAVCLLSGTRQRLCSVLNGALGKKSG